MNEQKIHELLQLYFDGATSLNEERELQRYFAAGDIPDSLKAYQPMFAFFAEERAVEPPVKMAATRNIRLTLSIIAGIAASIAILFMVGMPKAKSDNYVYYVDGQRIYDESAAIASAESKLQLLAESMQKAQNGMAALEKLHESSQTIQQILGINN